ncbi:UNVERIFIED_CONTAM: hypothetical protein K2H54_039456 [Gekko kuhli]
MRSNLLCLSFCCLGLIFFGKWNQTQIDQVQSDPDNWPQCPGFCKAQLLKAAAFAVCMKPFGAPCQELVEFCPNPFPLSSKIVYFGLEQELRLQRY